MKAVETARRPYFAPRVESHDFSRPFAVSPQSLIPFLRSIALRGKIVCRSYVLETARNLLAFGNLDQPTLDQVRRNEGDLRQGHIQVADAVWPGAYLYRNIIGGFVDIEPKALDSFAVRIFGYSNTFTAVEDGFDDKADFDRQKTARKLVDIAQDCKLNVIDSVTEADHIKLLIRIAAF